MSECDRYPCYTANEHVTFRKQYVRRIGITLGEGSTWLLLYMLGMLEEEEHVVSLHVKDVGFTLGERRTCWPPQRR